MTEISVSVRAAVSIAVASTSFILGGAVGVGAALASFALTFTAMPVFQRYAMARPNARSSHTTPIPQGGGAALVIATLSLAAVTHLGSNIGLNERFAWIAAAALLLATVGAADDIFNLPVVPRLALQFAAVAAVVVSGLTQGRLAPILPFPVEAALLTVAGVWFVNLTNFMDGIDGITLAGFLPLAAAAAALGWAGLLSPAGGMLAIAFFGALAGFTWFNLPRAKLFLGDVGSLPIGLIGGALIFDMAQHGAFAAAVILPLYHIVDATLTLFGRIGRRERVWEAHRQHAYQRAVDGGWSHARVSGMVLLLNIALGALALVSARMGIAGQVVCVGLAALGVAGLILRFRSVRLSP